MTTFVLVHGGWHGGWCWDGAARRLRGAGHRVIAPTLTGLAERAHLIDAVTNPDTHVEDVAALFRWQDLRDVVLVGHSYGGMITTGVATQYADRIAHLVYLDAFVPTRDHESAQDMSIPSRRAEMAKAAAGDGHVAPNGFERWSENPETIAWLKKMATPHPKACFGKGVSRITDPSLGAFARHYVLCARHDPSPFQAFYARYATDPRWNCHRIDSLHDAMVDHPDTVTDLLLGLDV